MPRFGSTVFVFGVNYTSSFWPNWMRCRTVWSKSLRKVHRELKCQKPAEMSQTPAKGAGKFCPKKISAWRRCTRQQLDKFVVTRPPVAATLPSHFYCRVCRKNVSVLTYGHHEVLRHFQGSRHFARDLRLRLEKPGWRVLDFPGNPVSEDELEQHRAKIKNCPFVVRDRKHPFAEDLIDDEAGVVEPQLPVLTKVSGLVDALKMGGSYELVEKLWVQFVLTAGPVNIEVAWTRDEVLVGSVNFRNHFVSFPIYIVVLLLVNPFKWNATPNSVTPGWLN